MLGKRLRMSEKERQRKVIVENIKEGYFNLGEGAERLKISYRQMKRIYSRYRKEGDKSLIHGSCGKTSHGAYSEEFRGNVLSLYCEKYNGFGPTFACEKLSKEGYELSDETLRIWLIDEGLWEKQRKRSSYRKRRPRKACFGEMLQLDGSPHAWFGEAHPHHCLMNLVDDATGSTMALLRKEETTEGAMTILKKWIDRYGIPKSIYVDLKTVYVSPKNVQSIDDEKEDVKGGFTHFSKACGKLGIIIIKAYSPQAKGRVERNHGVYQDRFVKELKLQNIHTLEKANDCLENGFSDELNEKFAKAPLDPRDAHRAPDSFGDLNQIFCWEYTRHVQHDWTIQFKRQHYQIERSKPLVVRAKQKVLVREHLNGSLSVWFHDQKLLITDIEKEKRVKNPYQKKGHSTTQQSQISTKNKNKTPWSRFNPHWLKGRTNLERSA